MSCRTCGREPCVCNDPDFEDAVCDRDRDTIIKLIAERNKMRDALQFYADSGSYCCAFVQAGQDDRCPVLRDDGAKARAALSANIPAERRDASGRTPPAGGSVCHATLGHHDYPSPHHCLLEAGHEGRHFCHICGLYWDSPNKGMSLDMQKPECKESP